jgi:hypothetical protein
MGLPTKLPIRPDMMEELVYECARDKPQAPAK